ncbi:MAG TPA: hypothetical protein VK369_04175, partial [Segetibacter sp.]|nr:hypothetical protein [Segetibacter sp.]
YGDTTEGNKPMDSAAFADCLTVQKTYKCKRELIQVVGMLTLHSTHKAVRLNSTCTQSTRQPHRRLAEVLLV